MATVISARFTLTYKDATSRNYTFKGIDPNFVLGIKEKVKALNTLLAAYYQGGEVSDPSSKAHCFARTFISNTGSKCLTIREAQVIEEEQEVIYSAS